MYADYLPTMMTLIARKIEDPRLALGTFHTASTRFLNVMDQPGNPDCPRWRDAAMLKICKGVVRKALAAC